MKTTLYEAVQTNAAFERERRMRARPWTPEHYEAVRQAALALVRTHEPLPLANGDIRASVDGRAFWELLGALDRAAFGFEEGN